jgi:hypothetical protein
MEKIKFKHDFLIFLYAYLRHIDLSLDRSRWTSWQDYVNYSRNVVSPKTVSDYLKKTADLSEYTGEIIPLNKNKYAKSRWLHFWRVITFNNDYLNLHDIIYICNKLDIYNTYLNTDRGQYDLLLHDLRIDIGEVYDYILMEILSQNELNMAMKVEHYLQNHGLETIELKYFLPSTKKHWQE